MEPGRSGRPESFFKAFYMTLTVKFCFFGHDLRIVMICHGFNQITISSFWRSKLYIRHHVVTEIQSIFVAE